MQCYIYVDNSMKYERHHLVLVLKFEEFSSNERVQPSEASLVHRASSQPPLVNAVSPWMYSHVPLPIDIRSSSIFERTREYRLL